jgi:hypothetical protein
MAGISATSVTKTHVASGADVTTSGFISKERVTLAASPAGGGYAWSLSVPSDSAPARSALDDATGTTPAFTPDVPGIYVASVLVDGATLYVLRLSVAAIGIVRVAEALNLLPLADSQVPTPQLGVALYYSTDLNAVAKKDTSGTVTAL